MEAYSMSQAPTDECTPEESSWTMYLEDFGVQNNNIDHHQSSAHDLIISSSSENSLISDAGSLVANNIKFTDNTARGEFELNLRLNIMNNRRLSFKKRKTKETNLVLDDSLEDTASSPVHSPKVFNLSQFGHHMKSKQNDQNNISEEIIITGSTSGQIDHPKSVSDAQLSFIGSENDRYTLKKKGLCLVPLSMLVNFRE
ncbi:vascular-related unknown protein 1-like [Humulus lupulus]|uniref:vascular-related unknown protein 1-like n=1 Tax=Humulus lupulus TaxID=3486 RepID=UPI002B402D78|nr:vascular-related unknown protein 1-like [Humulus lupulus]